MNYKETNISGITYRRSNGGSFSNPYNKTPFLQFSEEDITLIGDETLSKPVNRVIKESLTSDNYNKVIPILHLETEEVAEAEADRLAAEQAARESVITKD
jgi:hypothetical protein